MLCEGIRISKLIEVIPKEQQPYKVTVEEAKRIVKNQDGIWHGRNRIILHPDRNVKTAWHVKQSGYAGPLVMQATV